MPPGPFVADFHIHSKYSRATSPDMDLEHVAAGARRKGIALMGTGDFTHPKWLAELKAKLDLAIRYGIPNIKLMFDNDPRFLAQF